jgi:hypothetical protein
MLPSWLPLGTFQHALPRSEHSPGTCQQALHGTLFAFYWKKSGHDRIATDTLDATLSAVSWNTSTRSVCQALDFSTLRMLLWQLQPALHPTLLAFAWIIPARS